MSHIHTEPGQHDFTGSGFIIRTDTPEPRLMLHMHKKLHRYMQFGGHVELNETPWQAAKHEIEEESGYVFEQLTLLQPPNVMRRITGADLHPYPLAFNTHMFDEAHSHTDISFVFTADQEPKSKPGEDESQELRLFTRKELLALTNDEISEGMREICLFALEVALPNWKQIPAAEWSR